MSDLNPTIDRSRLCELVGCALPMVAIFEGLGGKFRAELCAAHCLLVEAMELLVELSGDPANNAVPVGLIVGLTDRDRAVDFLLTRYAVEPAEALSAVTPA